MIESVHIQIAKGLAEELDFEYEQFSYMKDGVLVVSKNVWQWHTKDIWQLRAKSITYRGKINENNTLIFCEVNAIYRQGSWSCLDINDPNLIDNISKAMKSKIYGIDK